MILTRKTLLLLAAVVALVALNLLDSGNTYTIDDALPSLPAMSAEEVRRIEVSSASAKTILVQEDGVWQITAPIEAKADQALLAALIATFRKPTAADVRVDQGNLEEYGLDASNGIIAELWLDGEEPAASFTVGYDAPGGASFVRISGDDAVYRMRVGGRHRYDMPPLAWRNRVLLDYDYTDVAAFEIAPMVGEPVRFIRGISPGLSAEGVAIPGSWSLDPAVSWQLDQQMVEAMVRAMGTLRAGGLLGSGLDQAFAQPAATLTATLSDGTTRQMVVSRERKDNAGFVKVGDEAFQVSASRLELALKPKAAFQDLTIFAFARAEIDTMSLEEGTTRIILQQAAAGDLWTVLQPENIDIDLKQVYFTANNLRDLRAMSIASASVEQAGLLDPRARISARLLDGRELTLEIGRAASPELVYVRRSDSARVYTLSTEKVEKLKRGFGRG